MRGFTRRIKDAAGFTSLAPLTEAIAAKFQSSGYRIFSELWVIYRPDGRDGVENALPAVARGTSGSGGALLPARGTVRLLQ